MSHSHSVRSASLHHLLSSVSFIPLLAAGMSAPAEAQTALELPGIVVEGATLEAPRSTPKKKPAAAAASAPTAAAEGQGQEAAEGVAEAEAASDQAAGVPAAHLGTAVTVVTGEDLQRQQIRHAADALRSLPGVSVSRTGSGVGLTQVRIRGGEANHTLVLIDGIEVNTASEGEFDFSNLLVEDIERIEVIRGPQSALYGSNAVTGVINIITKKGGGPLTVTARAEGGSFGTAGEAARVSGGNERIWGSATVQHERSDGFNLAPEGHLGEKDGYRISSISANAGAMLTDDVRLDLNIRHSKKHLDRDDQTGFDTRKGLPLASDTLSRSQSSLLLMGTNLRWDMLGGNLTHVLKANRASTENRDLDLAFGAPLPFRNESESYRLAYQATYKFETPLLRHAVTGLVDRGHEAFDVRSSFGSSAARRNQTGLAAEWRGDVLNRVFLSASARHDENDTFENFTTWRSAVSIPISELGIRPHASIGTGVKVPTMFEQFGTTAAFIPNPNLVPEESMGWDAGVEFTFLGGRALVDVTYFNADLKNLIKTDFVICPGSDPSDPNPPQCATPINLVGKSRRQGIEIDAKVQLLPDVSIGLAYTYLDAVNSEGVREIRRPPHSLRAELNYQFHEGRGVLRASAIYNGEMADEVWGMRANLDDYWLVSVAGSYKLSEALEIYGRVENLLDEDYEEIFGFATPGVAAYAGLRWTFDYERPGNGLSMK